MLSIVISQNCMKRITFVTSETQGSSVASVLMNM